MYFGAYVKIFLPLVLSPVLPYRLKDSFMKENKTKLVMYFCAGFIFVIKHIQSMQGVVNYEYFTPLISSVSLSFFEVEEFDLTYHILLEANGAICF